MSNFSHNDNAKAIAIPRVFPKTAELKMWTITSLKLSVEKVKSNESFQSMVEYTRIHVQKVTLSSNAFCMKEMLLYRRESRVALSSDVAHPAV